MRRLLILVAALALLTTACKIEINAHFTINADKSGTVVIEFGYDDEIAELAASQGGSPEDMLEDFDVEDLPGATVTEERRGDMTFMIITAPVDDITQAEGLGGEMAEGLADGIDISFTEDLVTVSGNIDMGSALGEDGGDLGVPPEMLSEFFEVNLKVTMPGKVLEHNADSIDGSTLTWTIDLTAANLSLQAESDPNASSGGSSIVLYVLIAAGAVLVLLILWYLLRNRGGKAAAAPAVAAPPAEDVPPPAPPPSE